MTPLERAARAIFDLDQTVPGKPVAKWDEQCAAFKEHHVARAAAVLTAIREPSEAMDRAAAECESSYVGDVYTAMIDAALAEEG